MQTSRYYVNGFGFSFEKRHLVSRKSLNRNEMCLYRNEAINPPTVTSSYVLRLVVILRKRNVTGKRSGYSRNLGSPREAREGTSERMTRKICHVTPPA